jgi:hypothetical protein
MAGVTWTRTRTSQALPTGKDVELMALRVSNRLGQEGVAQIRDQIWAIRRFKKPTGRSTAAWTYRLSRKAGVQEIRFINPAVDRGVNYPRYVHLSGRPRNDVLMLEVDAWAAGNFAPRLGQTLAEEYVKLRASQPVKVERD